MWFRLGAVLEILVLSACAAPPVTSDGGDASRPNDAPMGACTSAAECNDNIDCTDDACITGACAHAAVPARCATGTSCDVRRGCTMGRVCGTAMDCADTDPCTVNERCDGASRVCLFDPLDGDHDGHPPRSCGGDDCDDARATVFPGATEICDGADNNCDSRVDEAPAEASCNAVGAGHVCASGGCQCASENPTECSGSCVPRTTCACPGAMPWLCGGWCTGPVGQCSLVTGEGCSEGQACDIDRLSERTTCMQAGTGGAGARCTPGANPSECRPGFLCYDNGTCRQLCCGRGDDARCQDVAHGGRAGSTCAIAAADGVGECN